MGKSRSLYSVVEEFLTTLDKLEITSEENPDTQDVINLLVSLELFSYEYQ